MVSKCKLDPGENSKDAERRESKVASKQEDLGSGNKDRSETTKKSYEEYEGELAG